MNTTKVHEFLDRASQAYYSGSPFISDEVFDQLARQFNYQKVGAQEAGQKVRHAYPMYSLQKHYEDEGARPLQGVSDVSASPKLDGAAISLLYLDGILVRALTRGDGVEGQDITDKFLATNLVPHTVEYGGILQVTGEICAPKHIENSRNYAAGALNLKSLEEFKTRAVSFFAYGAFPSPTTTYNKDMEVLKGLGFATVKEPDLHNIYPCDGIVYRVNSNNLFREMGFTSKHPRGAYALKERQEAVETQILDVEWQVGKSGKVTPVAILAPVMIGDAEVSRATLNNPGFIETLGIEIGDTVAIIRSGEVIPKILHKVDA
jgi:NAD-dependent DNA ligase